MVSKIIGLAGKKGAGKDAAATALVAGGWVRTAFGDPLKEEVAAAFGISVDVLNNRDLKETPLPSLALVNCSDIGFVSEMGWGADPHMARSPRWVMQQWGTEYRRKQLDGYWVSRTVSKIKELVKAGKSVVVTDARFKDEADAIRNMGGTLVQVIRPNNPFESGNEQHASETSMTHYPFDFVLYNNGTEAGLCASMLDVANAPLVPSGCANLGD